MTKKLNNLKFVGEAQQFIEKQNQKKQVRNSPQLSCTITLEDKHILNELVLYLSNKSGKVITLSAALRTLIHFAHNRKNELE